MASRVDDEDLPGWLQERFRAFDAERDAPETREPVEPADRLEQQRHANLLERERRKLEAARRKEGHCKGCGEKLRERTDDRLCGFCREEQVTNVAFACDPYSDKQRIEVMRDPDRVPAVLAAIERVWRRNPDVRLCQLLVSVAGDDDLFYLEDDLLAARLNAGATAEFAQMLNTARKEQ